MYVRRDIVEATIARAEAVRFQPEAVAGALKENDRSKGLSPAKKRSLLGALVDRNGGDEAAARVTLERLIGGNDLTGVAYLAMGTRCAHSVCRIRLRDASGSTVGYGTGFLVAPGVLMTNHHVISTARQAGLATAEFDYELDIDGNERPVVRFAILADPEPVVSMPLDFCLAGVSSRSEDGAHGIDEFAWLPLDPTPGKTFVGDYLTIVQHPGGERKQVCVRENKLLRFESAETTLWYATDTVAGSSGSPVFNQSWQVVALHHSGIPRTDAQGRWLTVDGMPWDSSMDESRVAWLANEGIRVSWIVGFLQQAAASPLSRAVLDAPARKPIEAAPAVGAPGAPRMEARDGELRVTIPIEIAVRVGSKSSGLVSSVAPASATGPVSPGIDTPPQPVVTIPPGLENVTVDQTDYGKRPGFDPAFLGVGPLAVPLPKRAGGPLPVLKYWNYTVLMNPKRRLAFFSAVNVDANKRPKDAGRDGDRWYFDTRLDEAAQLGPEFYGKQKEFEVSRDQNPFDRGHLTRRLDAQWGATPKQSKRNGDDSFHWANCAPQHWQFNQGAKKWLGLEDYVVSRFASETMRACIVNGPVFDAPLSKAGPSGRPIPQIGGKKHKDPVFGDVAIPKLFFKVVACVKDDSSLAVAAFLMSQEEFLVGLDRIQGMPKLANEVLTDAEARFYKVSLADVSKLTGLAFGTLASAEEPGGEESLAVPRPIDSLEELDGLL
jgi:endonuclease G